MSRLTLGRQGENQARQYLEHHGLKTIAQNWRLNWGEIDLIMQDGPTLVFVEVKTKTTSSHGQPWQMVTPRKHHQLHRLATAYLQSHPWPGPTRLDVISITLHPYRLRWFKNITQHSS